MRKKIKRKNREKQKMVLKSLNYFYILLQIHFIYLIFRYKN